ncbi:helix-turn-helix domain-containing protein [Paenibacillus sp. NPDC058174]|uniref:helix-turn-helix domain-containing protein n=1 Tax=Paenibacillus sp. NPDC058174 TaxID=3346366 RepID=UPI0036DA62AE
MKDYDSLTSYMSPPYGTIFAGHFNEDDRYMTSRPSGMTDWLIALTLEGSGYFRTPSGERICQAGDIALLRSGVAHQYGTVSGGSWNFIWAHFPKLTETGFLPNEELIVQPVGNDPIKTRIYRALRNVLHDSREQRPLWQPICENEIRGILLLMAEREQGRVDPRIEESLHYLSKHMSQNIRIEDVAKSIGLSESRLSHLFKQETGATIVETLNAMRIRQAALLMKHSGRTASEAALDVGFQHYNHFAVLFRQQLGMTPREYRRQMGEPDPS